jgi:hypothetical protein
LRVPELTQPAALLEGVGDGVRAGVLLALEDGAALVLADGTELELGDGSALVLGDGSELELLEGVSLCKENEGETEARYSGSDRVVVGVVGGCGMPSGLA